MIIKDELYHYGTKRHSGRFPWGSGDKPYQHEVGFYKFLGKIHDMKKAGVSETAIAASFGMNTKTLRAKINVATEAKRYYEYTEIKRLHEKGLSNAAISRRMQIPDSTVRSYLKKSEDEIKSKTAINADILKQLVSEKGFIDVGSGSEQYIGISKTRLDNALEMLREQGYEIHSVPVKQLGTGEMTTVKVLAAPGTKWADVAHNKDKIRFIGGNLYSEDGGETLRKIEPPQSIDSSRVLIRYNEEGGIDKDGLIELRRGVEDISLKDATYAQVRIAVDGTHYIKGMAIHTDDIPDGYDIVFNTNKHLGMDKMDVLKPMENDPENPFGATIRSDDELIRAQRHYIGEDGKEHLSALNIVNEEGNWDKWSKSLASQMLSKQNPSLAKQQLNITYENEKAEFDEIMSISNPTLKANLLNEFASQCDSDAVNLSAAALPRQATKVLIPFPEMNEKEIYAPNLHDGEKVALIRYPHGGIFEIPILTVNNKYSEAKKLLGNAVDAVGISPKTGTQLSGADYDGDTSLVIPIDNVKIRSMKYLDELIGFDPKEAYPYREGMKEITTDRQKGIEMGRITNLITDMTIKGADFSEIARAVKHSMVIIDSKKHHLDYTQSEKDNGIQELRKKYQDGKTGGASTLFSRTTSESHIPDRIEKRKNELTKEELDLWNEGHIIYKDTGKTKNVYSKNPDGSYSWKKENKLIEVEKGYLTDDAYSLVSGTKDTTTVMETIYADHSNKLRSLANLARKEARSLEDIPYSSSARKVYSNEYASLNSKLNLAKKNAPLERQAQIIAGKKAGAIIYSNPDLDYEHRKKIQARELQNARKMVGAKKQTIIFTEKEWEAVNSGAIPKTKLKDILANADKDNVRSLALPKTTKGMSAAKIQLAEARLAQGYTQADVADMLGVSVSTMMRSIGPVSKKAN